MKNVYILLFVLTAVFAGCSDFLEESSQDEVRPSTVTDMDKLIQGQAYHKNTQDAYLKTSMMFTDDFQCNGNPNNNDRVLAALQDGRWLFAWDREMFDDAGPGNDPELWEVPYQLIMGCNVILDCMPDMEGDRSMAANITGEALALRAFYYLNLVNLFGKPYNDGDPAVNLGVPLKLDMNVTDERQTRNTVAEVYRSIENDLLAAERLMRENPYRKITRRMDHLSACALLSRMYLYMENWDEAEKWASEVIRVKPELLPLTSLRTGTWGDLGLWQGDGVYGELTPTEIIWGRPGNTAMVTDTYNNEPYGPSNDICGTFVPQANGAIDLRLWYYVMRKQVGQYDFINKNFDKDLGMSDGIRVSEMYLNRAEARIMKYLAGGGNEYRTKALEDLNCLRSHRFQTNASRPWQSVEIVDGGELLEFCRAERRRELCGESNHRWFDLRRWGQPALKHVFHINAGEETTYDLAANGAGYVLPIPEFVIGRNPKLRQNQ